MTKQDWSQWKDYYEEGEDWSIKYWHKDFAWTVGPHHWRSGQAKTVEEAKAKVDEALGEWAEYLEALENMSKGRWRAEVLEAVWWGATINAGEGL